MKQQFDLIVLGGGPGGYTAAIEGAKKGLTVGLIEKALLGGTCLHQGCIPTKSYLQSAAVFTEIKQAESFGISGVSTGEIDLAHVKKRTAGIIADLTKGVEALIKQNKIMLIEGVGTLLGTSIFMPRAGAVSVTYNDGREAEVFEPNYLILATGSKVQSLPGIELDEKQLLSSNGMLELETLPKDILIIGGGVIGLEWASMLNDFGVNVTVVEAQKRILAEEDRDISASLARALTAKGIKLITGGKVLADSIVQEPHQVTLSVMVGEEQQVFTTERVLVAVGRQANYETLGLENTKVEVERGRVKVNENYQTNEAHIYAIGDLINTPQLAHVAMAEGVAAVTAIVGGEKLANLAIGAPRCIYTVPEVAVVGLNEEQAKAQGLKVKKAKVPFGSNSKAMIKGQAEGFMKLLMSEETGDLIGASMIGPDVTELISETSLALYLNSTPGEIAATVHPHPSLAEMLSEVAKRF